MKHKIIGFFPLFLLLLLIDCKNAEVNYLQNIENAAIESSIENAKLAIQPTDVLSISITAKDPEVVKPFIQGGRPKVMSQQQDKQEVNHLQAGEYVVDSEGYIVISTLGKVLAKDRNIEELRAELIQSLKKYIKDPIVTVTLSNFKVTILGEINKPGTYPMMERATIFQALGAAGDLTIYGERKNILLVRNTNGVITKHLIDITDSQFINSPYYYLNQNDVLYVSANKAKANSSKYGSETSIYITVGSVIISVLLTVVTLIKK